MWMLSFATALTLLFSASTSLTGQGADPPLGWEIERSAFADLWFGALTSVGFDGPGPVPLYATEYAGTLRAAKQRAGLYPTRLDREGDALAKALAADPTFELLHFVPVYLAGAAVPEALDALRAVAAGSPTEMGMLSPRVASGARAIASVLRSPDQRRLLGRLTETLGEEWRALEALEQAEVLGIATSAALDGLQQTWDRVYAPGLTGFLARWGLDGGVVIVTQTVGLEGRFYRGSPTDPSDNVVVVGMGSEPDAALSGLVRELCFAVVRSAFEEIGDRFDDRSVAARESDHAATRCGALVVERYAPDALPGYRARFGASLDRGAPPEVDPDLRRAVDDAIARAIGRD